MTTPVGMAISAVNTLNQAASQGANNIAAQTAGYTPVGGGPGSTSPFWGGAPNVFAKGGASPSSIVGDVPMIPYPNPSSAEPPKNTFLGITMPAKFPWWIVLLILGGFAGWKYFGKKNQKRKI